MNAAKRRTAKIIVLALLAGLMFIVGYWVPTQPAQAQSGATPTPTPSIETLEQQAAEAEARAAAADAQYRSALAAASAAKAAADKAANDAAVALRKAQALLNQQAMDTATAAQAAAVSAQAQAQAAEAAVELAKKNADELNGKYQAALQHLTTLTTQRDALQAQLNQQTAINTEQHRTQIAIIAVLLFTVAVFAAITLHVIRLKTRPAPVILTEAQAEREQAGAEPLSATNSEVPIQEVFDQEATQVLRDFTRGK